METGKRVFPAEFKRDALALVERSGKPLAEVARDAYLSDTTLHGWKQQMREHTVTMPSQGAAIRLLQKKSCIDENENLSRVPDLVVEMPCRSSDSTSVGKKGMNRFAQM